MDNIITKEELWNLPNEQITELTKGRIVKIVLNNGEYKEVRILNLLAAAYNPNLFIGFLTTDNRSIYLRNIDHVEL
ncbi:MAG: hypothetical protein IKR18_04175 [Bacteroidaceae bacterium]|nr:hypothetical protein [Bacteroidaceae bacterium]